LGHGISSLWKEEPRRRKGMNTLLAELWLGDLLWYFLGFSMKQKRGKCYYERTLLGKALDTFKRADLIVPRKTKE